MISHINKLKLYYNTTKYLSARQILFYIKYKLYRTGRNRAIENITLRTKKNNIYVINKSSYMEGNRARFLNQSAILNLPRDWNNASLDPLWLYHLHYFDFLHNSDISLVSKIITMNNWVTDNNDIKKVGWDPYPTSLRIVNWIKFLLLNNIRDDTLNRSVCDQIKHLDKNIEYHIRANHLFENIKAMLFGILYFKASFSDNMKSKYESMLSNELEIQIQKNGGHYELSPMYHNIVLEGLIDICQIYNVYNFTLPVTIQNYIYKMLRWSYYMKHADGKIAFFNDSTLGVALSYDQLKCYAKKTGIDFSPDDQHISDLGDYIVVRNEFIDLKIKAVSIKAHHQPGHSHSDIGSFELSCLSNRVFVNTGISTYHDIEKRKTQRSSKAHNLLTIDNIDPNQIWSKFRVASRASVTQRRIESNDDLVSVSISHDGFSRVHSNLLYKREWEVRDKVISINDYLDLHSDLNFPINIKIYYHLHPDINIDKINAYNYVLLSDNVKIINFLSNNKITIIPSTFCPGFNVEAESKCLFIECDIKSSINFVNNVAIKILI